MNVVAGNAQSQQDAHYPNNAVPSQSSSLKQLQQQVTQMSQLMNAMLNNKNTPEDHVAGLAYSMLSYSSHDALHTWIVDTGASNHMCCDLSIMFDLHKLPSPFQIALPNGQMIAVHYTGSVSLTPTLVLHHVLSVPTFHCNLMSISKLTQDSTCTVEFTPNQFLVKHNETIVVSGTEKGGLYYFFVDTKVSHINNVGSHVTNTSSKLWYLRLGHAPHDVLKHIGALNSMPSYSKECPVCPAAKQTMQPFPKHSTSHAPSPFHLVLLDVWGPYSVTTTEGCRYFLTIADDHSRATWTFLLPSKQEVFQKFKIFYNHVYTHFNTSIKSIRTDHGSEFLNHTFHDFLNQFGIAHQKSCTYTPQQNSRVERKHKHLFEVARALRFQSGLPPRYWGDCILTATHIINLLRTPVG